MKLVEMMYQFMINHRQENSKKIHHPTSTTLWYFQNGTAEDATLLPSPSHVISQTPLCPGLTKPGEMMHLTFSNITLPGQKRKLQLQLKTQ